MQSARRFVTAAGLGGIALVAGPGIALAAAAAAAPATPSPTAPPVSATPVQPTPAPSTPPKVVPITTAPTVGGGDPTSISVPAGGGAPASSDHGSTDTVALAGLGAAGVLLVAGGVTLAVRRTR